MNDLTKLLQSIEKRPLMYLRRLDIYLLGSFISGFFVCESINEIVSEDDRKFKDFFHSWLKEKYNFASSFTWSDMIKELARTEKNDDEISIFFREYNQFRIENR